MRSKKIVMGVVAIMLVVFSFVVADIINQPPEQTGPSMSVKKISDDWIVFQAKAETVDKNSDGIPDVQTKMTKINATQIQIDVGQTNTNNGPTGYKWASAVCPLSSIPAVSKQEYNPATQVWTNTGFLAYGKLTNFGMPSTWCLENNNTGYILFGSGSGNKSYKLDFPSPGLIFRLYTGDGTDEKVITYQNQSMVEYITDNLKVNATLKKWNSIDYVIAPNDLFISEISQGFKFGGLDNVSTNDTLNQYVFSSNQNIALDMANRFWFGSSNILDISDICSYKGCVYSIEDSISNETNLTTWNLTVNFTGKYINGTGVLIDPSFTFVSTNTNISNHNITTEPNNASHLSPDNSSLYQSLVAYYPFDADEHVQILQDGKIGPGVRFDDVRNNIHMGTQTPYKPAEFTIMAWVNLTATSSSRIMTQLNDDSDRQAYSLMVNSITPGKVSMIMQQVGGGSEVVTTSASVNDGLWHHVVGRFNTTHLAIFIDGELDANITKSLTVPNYGSGGELFIGSYSSYSDFYGGDMDDVRIFNSSLSAADIREIYSNESQGQAEAGMDRSGLVLELLFNSSDKLETEDTSVYANNASLTNFARALDYSGFNNDGYYNSSRIDADGVYDDYAVFETNTIKRYIKIPSTSSNGLQPTKSVSVSIWVNRRGTAADNSGWGCILCSQADSSSNDFGYQLFSTGTNTLRWGVGNGTTPGSLLTTTDTLTNGQWAHIVTTWNGSNSTIYINGVMSTTGTFSGDISYTGVTYVSIGSTKVGSVPAAVFNGSIDEVMIFNSSLTPSQVSAIYNNQSARFYPQGVQSYPFFKINRNETINFANITVQNVEQNYGSTLSARVGYWNTSYGYLYNDSVVGYWAGNGNAIDNTMRNNGTLKNGAITANEGVFNNSFTLDGINDFVDIQTVQSFDTPTTISVFGWVKADSLKNGATPACKWQVSTDWCIASNGAGNRYNVYTNGTLRVTSTTASQVGVWQHIGFTYNGANYVVYVNGVAEASAAVVGTIQYSSDTNITIGRHSAIADGNLFNGSIDEVIILNKSLSAEEVKQLYVSGAINHGIGVNWSFSNAKQFSGNRIDNLTIASGSDYLLTELVANSTTGTFFYTPIWFGNITAAYYNGAQSDVTPPTVTLTNPADNSYSNTANNSFNATGTDVGGLKNATWYWINATSGLTLNTTQISSPSGVESINHTEGDGVYKWNFQYCDIFHQCANTSANRTITIDTTSPSIGWVVNTTRNGTYAQGFWLFNVSANETNPGTINLTLYNTTGGLFTKIRVNSTTGVTSWTGNYSPLLDGNYTFTLWMNDSAGNIGQAENIEVTLDVLYPVCTWNTPTTGNKTSLTVEINVTCIDINTDTILIMNGTAGRNQTYTGPVNFTFSKDKNITLIAWMNDTFGHSNETNRTINIDTNAWFYEQYPNSSQSVTAGAVTTSAISNETLQSLSLWDSQTGNVTICSAASCTANMSTNKVLAQGTVRFVWLATDQLGNTNVLDYNVTVNAAGSGGAYACDIKPTVQRMSNTTVKIIVTTIGSTGVREDHTISSDCYYENSTQAPQNLSFTNQGTGKWYAEYNMTQGGYCYVDLEADSCGSWHVQWDGYYGNSSQSGTAGLLADQNQTLYTILNLTNQTLLTINGTNQTYTQYFNNLLSNQSYWFTILNSTTAQSLALQNGSITAILSGEAQRLVIGDVYRTELMIRTPNGMKNASEVSFSLYDPNLTVVETGINGSYVQDGVYRYNYSTENTTVGVYTAKADFIVDGKNLTLFTKFGINSSSFAIAVTTQQVSGGGGGVSITIPDFSYNICGDLVRDENTCYFYNGTVCARGCGDGYTCNANLQCVVEKLCRSGESPLFNKFCVPNQLASAWNGIKGEYNDISYKYMQPILPGFIPPVLGIPLIVAVLIILAVAYRNYQEQKEESRS